jgi:sugar lactone lactonase YvrE
MHRASLKHTYSHVWIYLASAFVAVAALSLSACGGGGGSSGYTVGGTAAGLGANPVVLQNNGKDNLTVSANGAFTFATKVASGSAYNISILTQPTDRICTVRSNSGAMASSNITSVSLVCINLQGGAIQSQALSLVPTVSTFAGGAGDVTTFYYPKGVTTDGTNLYDIGNHTIRKIVIATGVVTTLAGRAGVTGAADGAGTAATFNGPLGLTTDGTNLYVADLGNHKIRKIVIATGVVSSMTGTANTAMASGAADGAGAVASFNSLWGITTDNTNLYVIDRLNQKIRKIVIATGVVSSLTGTANTAMSTGAADGAATGATFLGPMDITTDGTNLYVADGNNYKIRNIVIATGMVSSVTGTANTAMARGAQDGPGATATFTEINGITTDGTNLYVTDIFNNKVRKIVIATGVVSSVTGTANTAATSGAADGAGAVASFNEPWGITTDGVSLYVVDGVNNTIRKIQ